MDPKLQTELETIYNELEIELRGHNIKCNGCGICCEFGKFDHVLFASVIEADYIISNNKISSYNTEENVCPFMKESQCTIRKFRTLGCRVFFCDKEYNKDLSQDIYNKYYSKVKTISLKYNVNWQYRPLLDFFNENISFK